MANICFSAIVTDNLGDFKTILANIEAAKEKFEAVDFMGFANWDDKYIFRFESNLEPEKGIARFFSKLCSNPFEFWYQETGCGFAGKMTYQGGKSIKSEKIPCDITNENMQLCIYYTDWGGIDWTHTCPSNSAFAVKVDSGHRFPFSFKVTLNTFTPNGEVICASTYTTNRKLKETYNNFLNNPEKVWEESKIFHKDWFNK